MIQNFKPNPLVQFPYIIQLPSSFAVFCFQVDFAFYSMVKLACNPVYILYKEGIVIDIIIKIYYYNNNIIWIC